MAKKKKRGKKPNIAKQLEREKYKMQMKAAEVALDVLNIVPLYVLNTVFGFGKGRGQRFMKEYMTVQDALLKNEVSIETIADHVKYTMDIEVNWES